MTYLVLNLFFTVYLTVLSVYIYIFQFPIFASIFIGLRAMCYYPMESLKTGGFGWIVDLTVPDPFYILPLVTGGSLLAVLEVNANNQMLHTSVLQ